MASDEPVYSALSNSLLSMCSSMLTESTDGSSQGMHVASTYQQPSLSVSYSVSDQYMVGLPNTLYTSPISWPASAEPSRTQDHLSAVQHNSYDLQTRNSMLNVSGCHLETGKQMGESYGNHTNESHSVQHHGHSDPPRVSESSSDNADSEVQSVPTPPITEGQSKPVKIYTCEECGKNFNLRRVYMEHCRLHTGDRPYECKFCGRSFRQINVLYLHERVHRGEKKYKCDVCDKSFGRQDTLKTHARTHTGEKPYKCSYCEKAFSQRTSKLLHENVHSNDRKFACAGCGMKFKQKIALQNHQKGSAMARTCADCQEVLHSFCAMQAHRQRYHVDRLFVCPDCGMSFPTERKLSKHAPCSGSNASCVFVCRHCSRTFDDRQSHGNHECTTITKNCYTCDVCGDEFSTGEEWKSHRMGHSEKQMFECSQCDMVFKARQSLARHMSVHGNSEHKASDPTSNKVDSL